MNGSKVDYNHLIYSGKLLRTLKTETVKTGDVSRHNAGFNEVLREAIQKEQDVKFSKHAQVRMRERNILLSQQEIDLISQAIEKAKEKGVRDSLVLMGDLAFIVNVPTKTVVTAVNGQNIKENVFTNIDGAVVL